MKFVRFLLVIPIITCMIVFQACGDEEEQVPSPVIEEASSGFKIYDAPPSMIIDESKYNITIIINSSIIPIISYS